MSSSSDLFSSSPCGTVLYIGAGKAQDLAQFQALNPKRIALIEANPSRAQALEETVVVGDGVEVLPIAIGACTGQSQFHVFNMADHSSLCPYTQLSQIFPGLREVEAVSVDTYMAHEVVLQLGLSPEDAHVLVLDAPGVEEAIVHSLQAHGGLHLFQMIYLRAGVEAFYENSKGISELIQMLSGLGYRMTEYTESDPDFPQAVLERDATLLENADLKSRVTQLEQKLEVFAERDQAQKNTLHAKETALAEANDTLSATQDRATKAEEALAALAEGLKAKDAALEERTTQLTAATARATKAEGAWKVASDTLHAKETALAEANDTLSATQDRATKAEEALAALAEDLKAKDAAGASEQDALKNRLADREQALERKDMDLGIALRSQVALQADLDVLRARYEALRAEKAEQDKLLLQVTTRLNTASRYLHVLNAAPDESVAAELAPPSAKKNTARRSSAKPSGEARARKTGASRKTPGGAQ